ncbi:MAG: DUF438 domain-containing protein [Bacilli bacterium]
MSELINNSKVRQQQLKQLIIQIHEGMPLEEAKKIFKKDFKEISTDEIVAMEQALVDEGMSIESIQSLCDIHAAVFDGSISDIHKRKDVVDIPGHPAKIFKDENDKIIGLMDAEIRPYLNKTDPMSHLMLRIGIERLMEVSKHYARKEYLFFPGLEKKNITSIPQVMWAVDDEIRQMLNKIKEKLDSKEVDLTHLKVEIDEALTKIIDMVTKENNILLPKLSETLSIFDWIKADQGSGEFGYFLEAPTETWMTNTDSDHSNDVVTEVNQNEIPFDAGFLFPQELNAMLNTLPLDLTFIDKFGKVKYFTQGKERIFVRPMTVIGRHVSMCHPPKSVHIVDEIINSFKTGLKDHEDFYINMGDKFVYIRYFAVRDHHHDYLGTLEVTQDIKPIRALEGEKRLVEKKGENND